MMIAFHINETIKNHHAPRAIHTSNAERIVWNDGMPTTPIDPSMFSVGLSPDRKSLIRSVAAILITFITGLI